ncbi:MAG: PadR family transcriptional regulator [Chloroflexi bacterium]|nr:PadR family transcriptional regulator [Chloroflexota bacterium]
MERELLLLGLLRGQEMHGYQLNDFIDCHYGALVNLKKPTAYRLLNKMADRGWVTYREEREANRPPRRVHKITPQGETAFQELLRESLGNYKQAVFPGNIALLFLHTLPDKEALSLLRMRRTAVEHALQTMQAHDVHIEGASFVILHQIRHLETELDWLDEVTAHLEMGKQRHSHGA